MGVQEMALMLLGIGILSEQFGGGRGLISLGTGIQTLVAAPLTGTGTGLTSLAGGLRDIFETFGDLGRGISSIFAGVPAWALPGYVGPGGAGSGLLPPPGGNGLPPLLPPLNGGGGGARAKLEPDSGGSGATLLPGGGGNVPIPQPIIYAPIAPPTPKPRPPQDPDNAGGSPSLRFYHVL